METDRNSDIASSGGGGGTRAGRWNAQFYNEMLNDAARNAAYERAIGGAVVPSSSGEYVTVSKNSENDLFDCNFTYIVISAQLHGYSHYLFPGVGSRRGQPPRRRRSPRHSAGAGATRCIVAVVAKYLKMIYLTVILPIL